MQPIKTIFTEGCPQDTTFLQFPHQTVCFSGHRPSSLPSLEETILGLSKSNLLKTLLAGCIESAIQDGDRYFLNGLAEGVDLWAAEYLLYRKQHGEQPIHLIGIEPCLDYLKNRHSGKAAMMTYVKQCDALITIPAKGKYSFLIRNTYMLNHSHRLICMICKNTGGTTSTLAQATKSQKDIQCISFFDSKYLLPFAIDFLKQDEPIPETVAEQYAYYQNDPKRIATCQNYLKPYTKNKLN